MTGQTNATGDTAQITPIQAPVQLDLKDAEAFFQHMRQIAPNIAVPDPANPGRTIRPLATLALSPQSDWATALFVAWSQVCDVLAFYQARYANEGYLGTATERDSVKLLLEGIGIVQGRTNLPVAPEPITGQASPPAKPGQAATPTPAPAPVYQIRPAISAETDVAFTLAESRNAPKQVSIPAGAPVSSHALDGQAPIVYETTEPLTASYLWNALGLAATAQPTAQDLASGATGIVLSGTETGLRPGDPLLALGTGDDGHAAWRLLTVDTVEPSKPLSRTLVTWAKSFPPAGKAPTLAGVVTYRFKTKGLLFGHDAKPFSSQPAKVKLGYPSAVSGGVWELSAQKGPPPSYTRTLRNLGLQDSAINATLVAPDGTLVIGTAAGVFAATGTDNAWELANDGMLPKPILTLATGADGTVYAGGNSGAVFRTEQIGKPWGTLMGGVTSAPKMRFPDKDGKDPTDDGTKTTLKLTSLPKEGVRRIWPIEVPRGTSTTLHPTLVCLVDAGLFANAMLGDGWAAINNPADPQTSASTGHSTLKITDALLVNGHRAAFIAVGNTVLAYGWTLPETGAQIVLHQAYDAVTKVVQAFENGSGKVADNLVDTVLDAVLKAVPFLGTFSKLIEEALQPIIDHIGEDIGKDMDPAIKQLKDLQTQLAQYAGETTDPPKDVPGFPAFGTTLTVSVPGATPKVTCLAGKAGKDASDALFLIGSDHGVWVFRDGKLVALNDGLTDLNIAGIVVPAAPAPGAPVAVLTNSEGTFGLMSGAGSRWVPLGPPRVPDDGGPVTTPSVAQQAAVSDDGQTILSSGRLIYADQWPDYAIQGRTVDIDATGQPPALGTPTVLLPADPPTTAKGIGVYAAGAASKTRRSDYGLSGQVMRVNLGATVAPEASLDSYDLRATTALTGGASLEPVGPAMPPLVQPVQGTELTLATPSPELTAGRLIALSGRHARLSLVELGGIWTGAAAPAMTNRDIHDLAGDAQHGVLAAAGRDGVYKTRTASEVWRPWTEGMADGVEVTSIDCSDSAGAWALAGASLYHRDWATWQAVPTTGKAVSLTPIGTGMGALLDDGSVTVLGADASPSSDAITVETRSPAPVDIAALGEQIFALDSDGRAWSAPTSGGRWGAAHLPDVPGDKPATQLAITSSATFLAVRGGTLFTLAAGTWQPARKPGPDIRHIATGPAERVAIAGGAELALSIDNGTHWQQLPRARADTDTPLAADEVDGIAIGADGTVSILTTDAEVLTWQDNEPAWTPLTPQAPAHSAGAWTDDRSGLWTIADGVLTRRDDPGWALDKTAPPSITAVVVSGDTVVVGDANGNLHSRIRDQGWTETAGSGMTGEVTCLAAIPDQPKPTFLAGSRGHGLGRFTLDQTAPELDPALTQASVQAVSATTGGEIAVVIRDGGIYAGRWGHLHAQPQPSERIGLSAVLAEGAGKTLVGTNGLGAFRISKGQIAPSLPPASASSWISAFLDTPTGLMIAARADAVVRQPSPAPPKTVPVDTATTRTTISTGFVQDLDQGFLTKACVKALSDAGVKLSASTVVDVVNAGRLWTLSASDQPLRVLARSAGVLLLSTPPKPATLLRLGERTGKLSPTRDLSVALPDGTQGWLRVGTADHRFQNADPKATPASEANSIAAVTEADGTTKLELEAPVQNAFDPLTVAVNANVVPATQGYTVQNEVPGTGDVRGEILGDGNAGAANQTFTLRQQPLAFVTAPPPEHWRSTLTVYVDGEPWAEVPGLRHAGPDAAVYVVGQVATTNAATGAESYATTVTFGDGVHGRRLPTGQRNVVANYRIGGGAVGDVAAGTITILQRPEGGVMKVVNPIPAINGQDAEYLGTVRSRAITASTTAARLVSVSDYASYAGTYPGVSSATATLLKTSSGRWLVVSISPESHSGDAQTLTAALTTAIGALQADPAPALSVKVARHRSVEISMTLYLAAGADADIVRKGVHKALEDMIGQMSRQFEASLLANQVTAATVKVSGVEGARCDLLYLSGDQVRLNDKVQAAPAVAGPDGLQAAELLVMLNAPILHVAGDT